MSDTSAKRGALIGCGFFAQNHMHAWKGLDGIDIVAVCDVVRSKAEAMAESFQVERVYTDIAEMLAAEQPDLVDIATTAPSHRPLVELACSPGRVVVCQKPFAETRDDAAAMVEAANASNTQLVVHENFRWQKPFVEIAERLCRGDIGTPRFARLSFRHAYDVYANQPYLKEVERLAIMDVGLHLFDLTRHLMGDARHISCVIQKRNPEVTGEDAFSALIEHVDNAVSMVDGSFHSTMEPEPFPQTLATIEGDTGTIELARDYTLRVQKKGLMEEVNVEPPAPTWGERPWHVVQDSVIRFQQHVVDVLHGRAEPQPSGAHNLETFALAIAAYEAAEQSATRKLCS